jgi:hypothetical protein
VVVGEEPEELVQVELPDKETLVVMPLGLTNVAAEAVVLGLLVVMQHPQTAEMAALD